MPELPEIASRAREMNEALVGRTVASVEVLQPKCLNVPPERFCRQLTGARIVAVSHRGKWLFVETDRGHLLLNLGMGGELLLVPSDSLPEKRRVCLEFDDGEALSINFWWLGHAHLVAVDELDGHAMTAKLGPTATDLSREAFAAILAGRRGRIKSLLLDQSRISGIGNAYIHDILFRARIHPLSPASALSEAQIGRLYEAIQTELGRSLELGGAWYESDLHGCPGGFRREALLVAYREGERCPVCGTPIEKIRTGSTASFVCPRCQRPVTS